MLWEYQNPFWNSQSRSLTLWDLQKKEKGILKWWACSTFLCLALPTRCRKQMDNFCILNEWGFHLHPALHHPVSVSARKSPQCPMESTLLTRTKGKFISSVDQGCLVTVQNLVHQSNRKWSAFVCQAEVINLDYCTILDIQYLLIFKFLKYLSFKGIWNKEYEGGQWWLICNNATESF